MYRATFLSLSLVLRKLFVGLFLLVAFILQPSAVAQTSRPLVFHPAGDCKIALYGSPRSDGKYVWEGNCSEGYATGIGVLRIYGSSGRLVTVGKIEYSGRGGDPPNPIEVYTLYAGSSSGSIHRRIGREAPSRVRPSEVPSWAQEIVASNADLLAPAAARAPSPHAAAPTPAPGSAAGRPAASAPTVSTGVALGVWFVHGPGEEKGPYYPVVGPNREAVLTFVRTKTYQSYAGFGCEPGSGEYFAWSFGPPHGWACGWSTPQVAAAKAMERGINPYYTGLTVARLSSFVAGKVWHTSSGLSGWHCSWRNGKLESSSQYNSYEKVDFKVDCAGL